MFKTIIQTRNTSYLQNEDGDWVDSNTNNVIEYGSALSYALEALDVGKTKEKAIKDLEAEIEKRKGNNAQVAKNFISVAKDAVDILNNDQFNVVNNSRILEVDIPDDKFLLDEQKNYFEQSEEVKSALAKAGFAPIYHETREWVRNEYGENAVKELDRIFKPLANGVAGLNSVNKKILLDKYGIDEETAQYISSELTQYRDGIYSATGEHLSINSGRGIYQYFTDLYASDRTASLHLNKNGIKGITYEGAVDGRCFVVFDDKAIDVINTYNQAAGPKAKTANLQKLEEAKRLYEVEGLTGERVYELTGWYKGKDKKWRFEIPDILDADVNVQFALPTDDKPKYQSELQYIYPNEKLYAAYPFLREVDVWLVRDNDRYAGETDGYQITLNAKAFNNFKSEKDFYYAKKVLVHEIQHIIQREEGFASGGNIEYVNKQIAEEISKLKIQQDKTAEPVRKWWEYQKAADDALFSETSEMDFEEINKLRDKADRFAEENNITEEQQYAYSSVVDRIEELQAALDKGDAYKNYRNLYGEIEARAAEEKAEISEKIAKEKEEIHKIMRNLSLKQAEISSELKPLVTEYNDLQLQILNDTSGEIDGLLSKVDDIEEKLSADAIGEEIIFLWNDLTFSNGTVKELEEKYKFVIFSNQYRRDALVTFKNNFYSGNLKDSAVPDDMLTEAEDAELVNIQEAWATAAEQYFLEGNAPSKELRSVFNRFKKWLVDIYKTIENFVNSNEYAIPISPEVKDVFDRMIASQEEIANMERVNGYFAKLPAVITSNLSEKARKRIEDMTMNAHNKAIDILTKQSLANFTEERKQQIENYRADVLPRAKDEIEAMPLYKGIDDIEEALGGKRKARGKDIAERYLNNDGKAYSDWREELNYVQGEINERLLPIIEELRAAMNNYGQYQSIHRGKFDHRINNAWFKAWQQQNKKNPSPKELRKIAYEIYVGERTDAIIDFDAESADGKAEIDELLEREKELLEKKGAVTPYRFKALNDADRMAFEMFAEKYGFGSGAEFANTILTSPTKYRAITARVDELVQQKFPDIHKERAMLKEATQQALYNDESGLVLGLELQLVEDYAAEGLAKQRDLETQQKVAAARWQQAVVGAKRELAEMSVAEAVRTSRFIAAERRAAIMATKAISEKRNGDALRYKNLQTLLHAMVQESLKMRVKVSKYRRYINKQFTVKKETWGNEVHFTQAAALLNRMGYRRKDYDLYKREFSLSQYVEVMRGYYPQAVAIPDWLLDESVSLKNPMQMTFDKFEDIVNALQNIKAIAKAEKGENTLGTQENYIEFTNKVYENLGKLDTVWKPVAGQQQKATEIEKFKAASRNTDNFFEMMDGWTYGFFSKTFGGRIKECNDNEARKIMEVMERFAAAIKKWLPDKAAEKEADRKFVSKELGGIIVDKYVLTRMLMNLGNEGNARVLCTTPPLGMEHSQLWVWPEGNISKPEAIERTKENLLNYLGKMLTKEDIEYAQAVIDIAGLYWDEQVAMEKQDKGFAPPKVEALPVEITLADGSKIIFKGGYFPLVRDGQGGSKAQGQEIIDVTDSDADQGRNIRTLGTGNGNLKERNVNAEYPINLNRGAEMHAIINGIHDLCWRQTMSDFRRMFNDENLYYVMKEKLGIANMRAFREMLEKCANPLGVGAETLGENFIGNCANWLRRKTVNFAIMGNLKTAIQNLGNIWLYGGVVEGFGYKDVMLSMIHLQQNYDKSAGYKSLSDFVNSKSIFMKERSLVPDITLRDIQGMDNLSKAERLTMEWGAKFLTATDNLTARPVWAQAYSKKINEGATEKEAVDFADMVIRRTLGSSRISDVSSIQRGNSIFKLFTMFQGFFNTQYNQWERQYQITKKYWHQGKKADAIGEITSFVAAKWFVMCAINLMLAGENPFDDDEDEWNKLVKEVIHYPISMLGPVGTAANATIDNLLGFKNYGYRITAADSAIQTFFRTSGKINKAITEGAEAEEVLEPATTLGSYYLGIPGQINKLFWNAYDILFNDMDPRFTDLLKRRPQKER